MIAFVISSKSLDNGFGDFIKLSAYVTFAFSNGYTQTICCCQAVAISKEKDQEIVGIIVLLTINFGMLVGGVL
jgi:hypothetical protein